MLYALIVVYGGITNGDADLYFMDPVVRPTMIECEALKEGALAYIKEIHPWVTYTKAVCAPVSAPLTND